MLTDPAIDDIGFDLTLTKVTRQPAGIGLWATGRVAGHRFEALVFADHAADPAFELGRSRVAKLWVQRLADLAVVANFDRGWDLRPTDAMAAAVVDFLAAGLADAVFGE